MKGHETPSGSSLLGGGNNINTGFGIWGFSFPWLKGLRNFFYVTWNRRRIEVWWWVQVDSLGFEEKEWMVGRKG